MRGRRQETRREDLSGMTVVEFRRRRRGGAEREGMSMQEAVEGNPGFANGSLGRAPDSRGGRSPLDPQTALRAEALARRVREHREAFACSQQEFARESGIS
jgi:hypothetical protein